MTLSPSLASCVAHSICSPRAFQPRSKSLQPIRGPVATWSVWRGGCLRRRITTNEGRQTRGLREASMTFKKFLYSAATMISFAALPGACLVLGSAPAHAQQAAVPIDDNDIGGVVGGPTGPDAGVWVIAETAEQPTKCARLMLAES